MSPCILLSSVDPFPITEFPILQICYMRFVWCTFLSYYKLNGGFYGTLLCYFNCTATTTVDFRQNSFIEWDFQDNFYDGLDKHGAHRTNLQLMFRTRQCGTSLLWKAQNAQKSEYLALEVGFVLQFG